MPVEWYLRHAGTLLRCLNGLVPATSGSITFDGTEVVGASPAELRAIRSKIGMIFQTFNLVHRTTVENNVLMGRLSSVPVFTAPYRLDPTVALISEQSFRPNPGEVAEILHIPIREIFESEVIHGAPWEWRELKLLSPVFEIGERVMFGATAHVFYELLEAMAQASGHELPPVQPGRYTWQMLLGSRYRDPRKRR